MQWNEVVGTIAGMIQFFVLCKTENAATIFTDNLEKLLNVKTLNIENIAVIEKAQIEFNNGLNVLTGETGAGKSIVVDSINAILGEKNLS